eukprot:1148746-Prymnesium_polylepis.1
MCNYIERWGGQGGGSDGRRGRPEDTVRPAPVRRAALCPATDFGYFEPLPEPHDIFDGRHRYVTMISPCPAKGWSLFFAIVQALPHVQFAAVSTSWTKREEVLLLQMLPNVSSPSVLPCREAWVRTFLTGAAARVQITVFPANPNIDRVLRVTKLLLCAARRPTPAVEPYLLVDSTALLRASSQLPIALAGGIWAGGCGGSIAWHPVRVFRFVRSG